MKTEEVSRSRLELSRNIWLKQWLSIIRVVCRCFILTIRLLLMTVILNHWLMMRGRNLLMRIEYHIFLKELWVFLIGQVRVLGKYSMCIFSLIKREHISMTQRWLRIWLRIQVLILPKLGRRRWRPKLMPFFKIWCKNHPFITLFRCLSSPFEQKLLFSDWPIPSSNEWSQSISIIHTHQILLSWSCLQYLIRGPSVIFFSKSRNLSSIELSLQWLVFAIFVSNEPIFDG